MLTCGIFVCFCFLFLFVFVFRFFFVFSLVFFSFLFFSPSVSAAIIRNIRSQELCESGGGRPELPVPNSPYGLCGSKATLNLNNKTSELVSCVKVQVAVLGSLSLIVRTVSVDVKQH